MKTETNALQTVSAPTESQHVSVNALMMNPEAMDRVMRMAEMMASGKSTIPVHLQKNPADCMAVVLQAMQWGMLPHVVAQKTHLVNGTLGYEAQLVNAVVQTSGTITGRFHYEYKGSSPQLECRVGAVIRGESEITWGNWLNESKVTTKNSPLWKTNVQQQMGYLQVKNWARLYCPGAILGVYSPDEFDQPQPINMGQANVVQLHPVATPDQSTLDAAQAAADDGVAAYSAWWAAAAKETRKAIGADHHNRLKSTAVEADKTRTVNSEPVTDTQPKRKTLAEVMAMLTAAKTLDALEVASDWIGDLDSNSDRKVAADKFEEMKFVLEME